MLRSAPDKLTQMAKLKMIIAAAALLLLIPVAANGQKFDRGIQSSLFVPKGQWLVGGNASYSDYGLDDFQFLVLDDVNVNGYTLNVSPFLGYFVKNNMAVGVRFGYKRTKVDADHISIDLGEDLSFEIKEYYNLQHIYYGTAMMRNYIALGDSKRFGLFNEVRFTLGGGQGKALSGSGETVKGTYQDIFEFQLGLAPGLAAFISNNVAVEVSVGVLGFNYKTIKQVTNQVYEGSYKKNAANFKIDLFSISLGMAFYLPTLKPSVGKVFRGNKDKGGVTSVKQKELEYASR